MEVTVFTFSSLVYVVTILALIHYFPNVFLPQENDKNSTDKLFVSYFLAGILAVFIHKFVLGYLVR